MYITFEQVYETFFISIFAFPKMCIDKNNVNIMDAIILNIKKKFSHEKFQIATTTDNLLKLHFEGRHFINDHYNVIYSNI